MVEAVPALSVGRLQFGRLQTELLITVQLAVVVIVDVYVSVQGAILHANLILIISAAVY